MAHEHAKEQERAIYNHKAHEICKDIFFKISNNIDNNSLSKRSKSDSKQSSKRPFSKENMSEMQLASLQNEIDQKVSFFANI